MPDELADLLMGATERAGLDEATARDLAALAYVPAAPLPLEAARAWVRHHRSRS